MVLQPRMYTHPARAYKPSPCSPHARLLTNILGSPRRLLRLPLPSPSLLPPRPPPSLHSVRSRDSIRGKRTASAEDALAAPLSPTPPRSRCCATCRGVGWGRSASSTTPLSLSPFTSLMPYSIMTFAPTRIIPKTGTFRLGVREWLRWRESAHSSSSSPSSSAGQRSGKRREVSGTGVSSRGKGGSGSSRTSLACVGRDWRVVGDVDMENVDSRRKMRDTTARDGDATTTSNLNHGLLFPLPSICYLYRMCMYLV
ncbi:hypothetical protein C8R45DRAFT_265171 [Mycena sanguinolenta]|nr:hypothetical protein C8R45DRAFT_265171 [Mycena sanguinolenta]